MWTERRGDARRQTHLSMKGLILEYKNILLEAEGRVSVLTINRPEKRNALDQATRDEILDALDNLHSSGQRVLVVTGAGEKAFIAGADITEFEGRTALDQRDVMKQRRVFDAIEDCRLPVIAMINGYCLGGGMELALACDIRIAGENAKLGQPEISLGIIPGGGGTQRLTRLVGEGKSMELILTGDIIGAGTAYDLGLVNHIFPPAELREATMSIAGRMTDKSPVALGLAKESIKNASRMGVREAMERETDLFCLAFTSEDKKEGVSAFLEKRKAEFKGR